MGSNPTIGTINISRNFMNSTLALLLSKKKDYLEYQQKCEDTRNERQIIADEKIEQLFENFIDKLHECIQRSNTPQILLPFRYMKSIKYVYGKDEFFEILRNRIQQELPSCLVIKTIYMSSNNHPTYGLLESAIVILEPTIKII